MRRLVGVLLLLLLLLRDEGDGQGEVGTKEWKEMAGDIRRGEMEVDEFFPKGNEFSLNAILYGMKTSQDGGVSAFERPKDEQAASEKQGSRTLLPFVAENDAWTRLESNHLNVGVRMLPKAERIEYTSMWGNPVFFCVDVPKMLYVEKRPGSSVTNKDDFDRYRNSEVIRARGNYNRFLTAYSKFWIDEPTSFHWNRRFHLDRQEDEANKNNNGIIERKGAPYSGMYTEQSMGILNHDGKQLPQYAEVWREKAIMYHKFKRQTGKVEDKFEKEWEFIHKLEDKPTADVPYFGEHLHFRVEVFGIKQLFKGSKLSEEPPRLQDKGYLKGWFHLKIGLYKYDKAKKEIVPARDYLIDRLIVSARGLTWTVGGNLGTIEPFSGHDDDHVSFNSMVYAPRRVWVGGLGEFVKDFPQENCADLEDREDRDQHLKFIEKQFIPCGTTPHTQTYYGNNFMFVRGHNEEHGNKYGGGFFPDNEQDKEAARNIRVNFKFDHSFCTKVASLDFVVNGVAIKIKKDGAELLKANTDPRITNPIKWRTGGVRCAHTEPNKREIAFMPACVDDVKAPVEEKSRVVENLVATTIYMLFPI